MNDARLQKEIELHRTLQLVPGSEYVASDCSGADAGQSDQRNDVANEITHALELELLIDSIYEAEVRTVIREVLERQSSRVPATQFDQAIAELWTRKKHCLDMRDQCKRSQEYGVASNWDMRAGELARTIVVLEEKQRDQASQTKTPYEDKEI